MNQDNLGDILQVAELIAPARRTSSLNGSAVDLRDYVGDYTVILTSSAGGGTSPTLDVKLQDSADNSTFADISGATFTRVTDAADSTEKVVINADAVNRHVRAVVTIGGTSPTFDMAVIGIGVKQVR